MGLGKGGWGIGDFRDGAGVVPLANAILLLLQRRLSFAPVAVTNGITIHLAHNVFPPAFRVQILRFHFRCYCTFSFRYLEGHKRQFVILTT